MPTKHSWKPRAQTEAVKPNQMAQLQYFYTETHVLVCNEAAISSHYIKTICTFVTDTLCKLCSSTFGSGWVLSPVLVLLTQRSWRENIITRVAPCRVAPEFQNVCFSKFSESHGTDESRWISRARCCLHEDNQRCLLELQEKKSWAADLIWTAVGKKVLSHWTRCKCNWNECNYPSSAKLPVTFHFQWFIWKASLKNNPLIGEVILF